MTWKAGLANTVVDALAIDPMTPSTLYAGAGIPRIALLKSTDGGASWSAAAAGPNYDVDALAIDPIAPSTLYAGTYGGGVFKSTDGGASWRAGLPNTVINSLAIDPTTPSTLHAGTANGVFSIQQVAVVCVGDCTGARTVAINDLITLVNIALGNANVSACLAGDTNHDNEITIDEILTAVNNALNGCGAG